jgi:hypothetical protein
MYDRWEFNTDGTFHFRHIHHGEPLDRGVYRYELKDGVITIAKEGAGESAAYTYVFSGNAVTLTPFHHAPEHEDAEPGAAEYHGEGDVSAEHADSGEHHGMGALLESPVTFTHAR